MQISSSTTKEAEQRENKEITVAPSETSPEAHQRCLALQLYSRQD
jgi:hypothetical protein